MRWQHWGRALSLVAVLFAPGLAPADEVNEAFVAYTQRNFEEARTKFRAAAIDRDNAIAQIYLGFMYYEGQGVEKDRREAFRWFERAARKRLALAQYNVGMMYADGQGVMQDYAQAVYWYGQAAAQGFAEAQFRLARMHQRGLGVPASIPETVQWMTRAAESGHTAAQLAVGIMFRDGNGVGRSFPRAHMWMNLAAQAGNAEAGTVRDEIARTMTPDEIAEAHALARRCKASEYKNCG